MFCYGCFTQPRRSPHQSVPFPRSYLMGPKLKASSTSFLLQKPRLCPWIGLSVRCFPSTSAHVFGLWDWKKARHGKNENEMFGEEKHEQHQVEDGRPNVMSDSSQTFWMIRACLCVCGDASCLQTPVCANRFRRNATRTAANVNRVFDFSGRSGAPTSSSCLLTPVWCWWKSIHWKTNFSSGHVMIGWSGGVCVPLIWVGGLECTIVLYDLRGAICCLDAWALSNRRS